MKSLKNVDPIQIGKLMRDKNLIDTGNHLNARKCEEARFNVKVLGSHKV